MKKIRLIGIFSYIMAFISIIVIPIYISRAELHNVMTISICFFVFLINGWIFAPLTLLKKR